MTSRGKPRTLYLCRTKSGKVRHITEAGTGKTLCGNVVGDIERNWRTQKPIKWADHWDNPKTYDVLSNPSAGQNVCFNCNDIRKARKLT
jgi:hypothetical protein